MMITDHSKFNDELDQVAKNHNIDFPPAPPAAAYQDSKTMLDLKGPEFDKVYMGEAVKGHTNDLAAVVALDQRFDGGFNNGNVRG